MSHSTCIGHKTWQWAFVSQCEILSVGPTSNVKPSRLKARKHICVITLLLNSLSGEFRFSLLLIHAICKAYVCYRNLQNIIIFHSCISFFVNFFIGQFLPCKGIDRPHLYTAIAMTEWSYTMYKRLETESLSFSLLTFIIPIESINWLKVSSCIILLDRHNRQIPTMCFYHLNRILAVTYFVFCLFWMYKMTYSDVDTAGSLWHHKTALSDNTGSL